MKTMLLLALTLSACVTEPDPEPINPVEVCGEYPSSPGIVASFPGDGTAVMTRDMYLANEQWRTNMVRWADCMEAASAGVTSVDVK